MNQKIFEFDNNVSACLGQPTPKTIKELKTPVLFAIIPNTGEVMCWTKGYNGFTEQKTTNRIKHPTLETLESIQWHSKNKNFKDNTVFK